MPYLLIRHKVKDFSKWVPLFDGDSGRREAVGSMRGRLFRNADNPNDVLELLEWDDLKKARQFAQSEELHRTMKLAGVLEVPEICFLQEAETNPKNTSGGP